MTNLILLISVTIVLTCPPLGGLAGRLVAVAVQVIPAHLNAPERGQRDSSGPGWHFRAWTPDEAGERGRDHVINRKWKQESGDGEGVGVVTLFDIDHLGCMRVRGRVVGSLIIAGVSHGGDVRSGSVKQTSQTNDYQDDRDHWKLPSVTRSEEGKFEHVLFANKAHEIEFFFF